MVGLSAFEGEEKKREIKIIQKIIHNFIRQYSKPIHLNLPTVAYLL
jgi:hypothetical protein